MKMNVIKERVNPYMKRKELLLDIEHEAESTPNKAAVQELLARQISADKEKIEIIDIVSEKGIAKSKSTVFIWQEMPVRKVKKAEKAEAKEEKKQEKAETPKKEAKKEEPAKEHKEAKSADVKEEKKGE